MRVVSTRVPIGVGWKIGIGSKVSARVMNANAANPMQPTSSVVCRRGIDSVVVSMIDILYITIYHIESKSFSTGLPFVIPPFQTSK
jgi:hypothetical protein